MKTTKQTSLLKRVQKLVDSKSLSKSTLVYGWVNEIANGVKEFRPVFTRGSGRFVSLKDKSLEFESVLKILGIEFISLNDAPRGGKTGYRIDILTKVIQ